jgi:4-amino-4-deoxy-L-arabinose transferase-like glycosyltransferase
MTRSQRAVVPDGPPVQDPSSTTDRPTRHERGAPAALRTRWTDSPAATAGLLGILLVTGVLYFWNLTANEYANSFYSAAAQAGSTSWKAFFFGSSDAASSITVDKPPASLWIMALSVRMFGLNSFAILMPQVLMGIATVFVVNRTVRRYGGVAAGLVAAGAMALTPVAVLMFRFNNPDALLVLLMTLGAWATLRAIEKGSVRWMAMVGVFLGFAFLTKTLQALLVVPFFGLAYLVCAHAPLRRRLLGLLAAVVSLVIAGGWWVAIVELMPASTRPYIGGSQNNSFLELTFGYNGLGRINGTEVGTVGGGGGGRGGGGPRAGSIGLARLFGSDLGGQISWLIPAALILTVAALWLGRKAARTDMVRASFLVFGGWFVTTFLVFSFMEGTFHQYYTVALSPAIAAMVGLGAGDLWRHREQLPARIGLSAAALATGVWGYVLLQQQSEYGDWLARIVLVAGVVAAVELVAVHRLGRGLAAAAVVLALISGTAGQAAYAVSTVTTAKTGSIIAAGPDVQGGMGGPGGGRGAPGGQGGPGGGQGMPGGGQGGPGGGQGGQGRHSQQGQGTQQGQNSQQGQGGSGGTESGARAGRGGAGGGRQAGGPGGGLLNATQPDEEVVKALTTDADQYDWVAAAVGSQNAAGIQLATSEPVMPVGGFNGSDPSPTLEQFQQYVKDGKIHYFLSSGSLGHQNGGAQDASEVAKWVSENYTEETIGSLTFYDLTQPTSGSTEGQQ